jgi:Fic/DOC family
VPGGWDWLDVDERSHREAENAVRQARRLTEIIRAALSDRDAFELELGTICELNALATEGTVDEPGVVRTADLLITASFHEPPPWHDVPALLEEMIAYVNAAEDSMYAAAYALWRLNWIHPFADGNGRTARAIAYLLISVGAGFELPGEPTLLERLVGARREYNRGLETADRAWAQGRLDVSILQRLLHRLFKKQIKAAGFDPG